MAKIILNNSYIDNGDIKETGKYLFDAEDGSAQVELIVWIEKSKVSEKHPDGKPWIKLPKDNITNRTYFSEDLFMATAADGEVTVEVKTSAPRILGASGVKQNVIKYLDEEAGAEYTSLVTNAVEAFKAAKASSKKKKPEEMTKDELEAYIDALRNGTTLTVATGPKSFLDVFSDEEYTRYNELLALAVENKANMPKAQRKPLTDAEKEARAAKRKKNELSKAEALLKALQASVQVDYDPIGDDDDADYVTDEE